MENRKVINFIKLNKRVRVFGFAPYHFLIFGSGTALLFLAGFMIGKLIGLIVAGVISAPVWMFMQVIRAKNKEGRIDYLRELLMAPRLPKYVKDNGVLHILEKQATKTDK